MIAWLKRLFRRKRKTIVGLKPISHGEWLMTLEWGSPEYEAVMRNARNMMRLTAIIHAVPKSNEDIHWAYYALNLPHPSIKAR